MAAVNGPGRDLVARIQEYPSRPQQVADFLDGLSAGDRVDAVRSLGRAAQRKLYAQVEGFRTVRLVDLVPAEVPAFTPVRHFGRNTLPAFTLFEKRFCRPLSADAEKPGELFGYNHQALAALTGPGYFVAREDPARGEVRIDYTRLPPEHPQGWPEIRSNERGVARFVYGFMVDTLRRVSEHVTIGSAARRGREMGSWFVLCRESAESAGGQGPGGAAA